MRQVRTLTYVEVATLTRASLDDVLANHPSANSQIRQAGLTTAMIRSFGIIARTSQRKAATRSRRLSRSQILTDGLFRQSEADRQAAREGHELLRKINVAMGRGTFEIDQSGRLTKLEDDVKKGAAPATAAAAADAPTTGGAAPSDVAVALDSAPPGVASDVAGAVEAMRREQRASAKAHASLERKVDAMASSLASLVQALGHAPPPADGGAGVGGGKVASLARCSISSAPALPPPNTASLVVALPPSPDVAARADDAAPGGGGDRPAATRVARVSSSELAA